MRRSHDSFLPQAVSNGLLVQIVPNVFVSIKKRRGVVKNNIIVALIVGALVLGFVCGLTVSKGNASLEQSIGELVGKVAVLEQKVEQFQNPSVEIEAEFIDPATLLQGGKPQAVGTSVDPSSWTVAKKAEDTEQPQETGP